MIEELKVNAIYLVREKQRELIRAIIEHVIASGVDDINDALVSTFKTVGINDVVHETSGTEHTIHVSGMVGDVHYEFSMEYLSKATPRPIRWGYRDVSRKQLPVVPEQIPTHLPLSYIHTERGSPGAKSGDSGEDELVDSVR